MTTDLPNLDFWSSRYRRGHTPWDLGGVSTPVRTLVQRWFPAEGRVFIPGCGRGYEALYLAARGYAVTALDIAQEPLDYLSREAKRRGVALDIRRGDLLALEPEFDGAFDVWLEQTCLCALHPSLHPDYERTARRLLRPGGQLLAVFMEVPFDDGPPYSLPPETVFTLFDGADWVPEGPFPVEPPQRGRPGPEYLARFLRRKFAGQARSKPLRTRRNPDP